MIFLLCGPALAGQLHPLPPGLVRQDLASRAELGIGHLFLFAELGIDGVAPLEQYAVLLLQVERAAALVAAGQLALALGFVQDGGGGHGDVEGLHHAHHGDDDMVIGQGQRLFPYAVLLLAHQDGGRFGVVDGAKVHRALREMGRQDLHAGGFEFGHGTADVRVQLDVDPVLAAAGGALALVDPGLGPDGVNPMDADGIGGAHDGGQIVRLVDLFHADSEIELALGQHVGDPFKAFRSHIGFYVVRLVHATRPVACCMGP